ncbi:MAG TPA: hypothetical protein PKE04_20495 [Clostridia bacterium]|nr:hypothetical protein [Clostridia bacterium]
MLRLDRWLALALLLALLAGVGHAQEELPPPYDDVAAYVQTLEEAMDARYGERAAWPQGFDAFLAVVRFFGGLDEGYELTTAWGSQTLQAWESEAIVQRNDPEAAWRFLYMLQEEMQARNGYPRTWPYEAHALINAAFVYSGNAYMAGYNALPGKEDLTEAEAVAIAREALQARYQLSDEEVERLGLYSQFVADGSTNGTNFWIVFIGLRETGFELYYAYIASPSGEILEATRNDGNG